MDEFAMHRAAEEGDVERVRQFIEGGVSGVDSRDDQGHTPLHRAAAWNRCEVAELLIINKCDLNPKDRRGRTPVLLAAFERKKAVVDVLLQHGAQVHWADDDKWTLLHWAASKGWTDTVHRILDTGEADPNAALGWGETPLMMARDWDVAERLIRAGADVHRSDGFKVTALHRAAWYGRTRVVQVLLEQEGLDLNPRDGDGETPLHWVCKDGDREVIKQLLVAGVDTTLKNNKGVTALSRCISRGELALDIVRLFVHHGAFLQECEYVRISENPFLKENVLKDAGLCAQSIVNKFHRHSLPALKSISYFATKLPNIDKFKLNARQIDEVENLVKSEIKRNTFCNVVKAHPMALSALCVLSLITCQSGTER